MGSLSLRDLECCRFFITMGPFQLVLIIFCASFGPSIGQSFDWQLLSKISNYNKDNVVISPLSLRLLMYLLYEASDNSSSTAQELKLSFYDNNLNEQINILANAVNKKGQELSMGTKIYVRPNQQFNEQYSKIINVFKSEVENVNFQDTKNAATKINNWVASATKGNIKNFVNEQDIKDTVMMLISALYFKGNWKNPFFEPFTKDQIFNLPNGEQIKTPFMIDYSMVLPYVYSDELEAKAVQLPYKGGHYSMTILLPNEGIDGLLQKMQSYDLNNLRFMETAILISIPKFKFDYAVDLNNALQALGIREIFTDNANFKSISENSGLQVSKVFQKSGIEVDERGSTAYGATGIHVIDKIYGGYVFHAKRPFIFFIEDLTHRTKPIIFSGIVNNPST